MEGNLRTTVLTRATVLAAVACLAFACSSEKAKPDKKKPTPKPVVKKQPPPAKPKPTPTPVAKKPEQPKPKPKPRLTKEQAQALLTRSAAEATKGAKANCAKIMQAVNTAAALVGPTSETNQQAFLAAAICAERNKKYQLMFWAARALAKTKPETLKLGIIPRALMHLKRPKQAIKALQAIDKRYPNAPGVLFAAMLLAKDQKNWKMAKKLAKPTVTALMQSQYKSVAWEATLIYARALLSTGDFKGTEQALAAAGKMGAPPAVIKYVQKKLIPVRKTKIYVDADIPKKIYLGTYHLHGKAKSVGDMFVVHITNLTGEDQSMKAEIEIPGTTDKVVKTVNMLKNSTETIRVTPPLKSTFNPAKLQAERNTQVNVKLTLTGDTPKVVFDESIQTKVYPRDQLPLHTNTFIPAWITPQTPEIEALLTSAKKRTKGKAMAGSLAPTMPQMRALYDELKARGMSYVLVTNFGLEAAQHTRLPADTIKSTNALCLDGTVLFAAVAEKLGLRPILVRVPGHIFFGWHATKADKAPPGTVYFLETTMVGTHTFDQAIKAGQFQFQRQKRMGGFKTGQSSIIDVIQLRGVGITPQPWG